MESNELKMNRLRDGLVVSCQADEGSPLRAIEHIVAMALAVASGGAVGLRIEGEENIAAVRARTDLPIIGLIKRRKSDGSVHITPTVKDALAICSAGADIVAFDATDRVCADQVDELCSAIHERGHAAMADVSTLKEAQRARDADIDLVSTTLAGYTPQSNKTPGPDFVLMQELAAAAMPFVAEGRIWTPEDAQMAIRLGAQFVIVGTAITRPDHIARRFASYIGDVRNNACGSARELSGAKCTQAIGHRS